MTTTRPTFELQDRIPRARRQVGLTKEQLAERIGVSARTISNWELGYHRPRRRDLIAIAQVCGVDLAWLTEDDAEPDGALVRSGARIEPNVRSANSPASPGRMTYHAARGPGRTGRRAA